jgi:beta-aspartyl-peptidase (threonine type)
MKRTGLYFAPILMFLTGCGGPETAPDSPPVTLVIHGGAGTITRAKMTGDLEQQYRDALESALRQGFAILEAGGSSLDAVEAAVLSMEDSPLFNAGKGAVFTHQGRNEMDAAIMNGADLQAGAVAAVTTIKNPIRAARAVMTRSGHVMLIGRGAEIFAAEQGLELVDPEYFFTQKRWDALLRAKEKQEGSSSLPRGHDPFGLGTVGAIALDREGNLAAATSTGGVTNKRYGRVGDTPIPCAGTYASNRTCAVSGTGQGEFFMRNLVAYDVAALMEYAGLTVDAAARRVIHEKLTTRGGTGGLIALDRAGNHAMVFNTEGMYRGSAGPDGELHVSIYGNDGP